jgi:hypothetical protein
MQHATIIEGKIQWAWKHSDFSKVDVPHSDSFWAVRLPLGSELGSLGHLSLYRKLDANVLLFDVNYLTTVFQPAVARAAERILANAEDAEPRRLAATAC